MTIAERAGVVKWLGGLSAVAGAWLVISPFVLNISSTSTFWNLIIVGALGIIFGLSQMAMPTLSWPSWANVVAAVWLIVSPYVLVPTESAAYTNSVVGGLVLGLLALAGGLVVGSLGLDSADHAYGSHHRSSV